MTYQYTDHPKSGFGLSLSDIAREGQTTVQKVSRIVKKLKIPVRRVGNMVIVDLKEARRILRGIKKADVTRPKI